MFNTLLDVETLQTHLMDAQWVMVDCRFRLDDTAAGHRAYQTAHIPRAVYAHLDDDLSGPPVTDHGRHPLPTPEALSTLFQRLGINNETQVVAYDDAGGMIASRLWWMLQYMGHEAAAVLDGGWQAWQTAEKPTRAGIEKNPPATFVGAPRHRWLVRMAEVPQLPLLIDARDSARYRGETENIDPRAGHIPQALNFPFQHNLDDQNHFLPADRLREQYATFLGDDIAAEETTFYCGSGVSACVNLLALAHAGLGHGRLYVGSWSEWSRTTSNPIETT